MPSKLLITVIALEIILLGCSVEGGFTEGAACNARNTALLSPSKPFFPNNSVKCVDITGMGNLITFQKQWPIRSADTLYADHMNMKNISRSLFTFMPNLELIDLTGNGIRKFPITMNKLAPKLQTLLLPKNRVRVPKKVPLIISYTVKTLMLSDNKIKMLQPFTFSRVPSLRILYLDSNFIKTVTAKMFAHLSDLKYLHLGNNLLKSVPEKHQMPRSLVFYIVKGNKLEEDDLMAR